MRAIPLGLVLSVLVLVIVTAWSYRGVLKGLWVTWQMDKDYSAGQLVPVVAAFLIWHERKVLGQCSLAPCWWGGIVLFLLSQMIRTYGWLFMVWSAWQYSLVATLSALVLLVAGWQVFRRVLWILLFLLLMFPLPDHVRTSISGPLQRVAATGAVFFLDTIGASVSQQGNVVVLGENTPIEVAEACNGLRMLTAFIMVTVFVAYMLKRPRWQKATLLASSIPVALICNIVRIFATAVLILHVSSEAGERFFHDFAGLAMMPAAVLLLFGELWLMERLVATERSQEGQAGAQAESGTVVHVRCFRSHPRRSS